MRVCVRGCVVPSLSIDGLHARSVNRERVRVAHTAAHYLTQHPHAPLHVSTQVDVMHHALSVLAGGRAVETAVERDGSYAGKQYGAAIFRSHMPGFGYAPHIDSVRHRVRSAPSLDAARRHPSAAVSRESGADRRNVHAGLHSSIRRISRRDLAQSSVLNTSRGRVH